MFLNNLYIFDSADIPLKMGRVLQKIWAADRLIFLQHPIFCV